MTRIKPLRILLALTLFCGASYAHAAPASSGGLSVTQSGSVRGTVTDPKAAVIANAHVSLRNLAGDIVADGQTDAGGTFHFDNVPPGHYTVIVDADGFSQPDAPEIDVKEGRPATVTIKLEVGPISEELSVSATNPTYAKIRSAKIGNEQASVENLVLKRDIATLTFAKGTFYFLPPTDGRVTEAVFIGEGEFVAAPIMNTEKKQVSILTHEPSLTDHFSKIALIFTDSTYDEIKKAATIRTAEPPSEAASVLNNFHSTFRLGRFMRRNFEARVLMDMLWPGSGGLFVAYFDGKRYGDLLFGLDPLGNPSFTPEEVMLMALSESNYGAWISEHLEGHYKNPGVFDEDHSLIDITNQDIDATIKGKKLTATAKTSFNSLVDGARVIPFNLFGRLRVAKITDEAGQNVKFIQEKREEDADLFVILDQGLKKGAVHTLTFEYSGDNAVADLGGNNFTLARRTNWYPNNAGNPLGDRATFEITLRVPKGLTAIATGDPVGQPAQEGGFTVTKWKTSVPIDVAGFNYGKYKTEVVKDDKVNCTIESYANDEVPDYIKDYQRRLEERQAAGYETFTTLDSINPAVLMKKARAEGELAVGLYTDYFGPIPYTRIAMTEQPFFNFGQAWPMLVYMPVIAYLDSTQRHQMGMDRANNFFKVVGPHEVSHQWWGHILGWKSYRDQWMSEGFANFSASLFAQAFYKGKDDFYLAFWKELREQLMQQNTMGKRPEEVGSVYMGYRLNTAKTGGFVTQSVIYPKGAYILQMLRMMMWDSTTRDQRFQEMMKDFVKTYYNQNVSTVDFQSIVEKHMTKEMDLDGNGKMDWFFAEWVYGTEVPTYKLDYHFDEQGGKVKLVGKITQSAVSAGFKMRVPVYLDFDGKIVRLGAADLYGDSSKDFAVTLPKKPQRVMLCHYEDVLCNTSDR